VDSDIVCLRAIIKKRKTNEINASKIYSPSGKFAEQAKQLRENENDIAKNIMLYRTVGVVKRLEARSVTCYNAQLPMLSEPCSCWLAAASVGSGH